MVGREVRGMCCRGSDEAERGHRQRQAERGQA